MAEVGTHRRGWLLVGSAASVLVILALIAAQLTFTTSTTPRDEVALFLDEAADARTRFLVSVVLFTGLAFLVVPVFVALRHVLSRHDRYAVDLALAFAVLGAALSAAADATQIAVGAETAARWADADATLRTVLATDAASLLWLGDALTNLARFAFGVAVGAASLVMWAAGSRVWRATAVLGLVAAVCALVGSFALAASGLEVVWVLGLLALLLWFVGTALGLGRAWQQARPEQQPGRARPVVGQAR